MATIILTEWHEQNPNDWVAIKRGSNNKPILYGRNVYLVELRARMKGNALVVYGKAWSMGIGKDYPITQLKCSMCGLEKPECNCKEEVV